MLFLRRLSACVSSASSGCSRARFRPGRDVGGGGGVVLVLDVDADEDVDDGAGTGRGEQTGENMLEDWRSGASVMVEIGSGIQKCWG